VCIFFSKKLRAKVMGKAYMEGSFESICKVNCFGIMLEVALKV